MRRPARRRSDRLNAAIERAPLSARGRKLMQRVAASGSAAPSPMGGREPYALAAPDAVVQELIETQPDLTPDELRAELADRIRTALDRSHKDS